MIHNAGLSQTLDAVNEAAFDRRRLPLADRRLVARWIAAREEAARVLRLLGVRDGSVQAALARASVERSWETSR